METYESCSNRVLDTRLCWWVRL